MSTVTAARLHHLALTVTDLDASVQWYGEVFDVHPVMDVPHKGGLGRILTASPPQRVVRRVMASSMWAVRSWSTSAGSPDLIASASARCSSTRTSEAE